MRHLMVIGHTQEDNHIALIEVAEFTPDTFNDISLGTPGEGIHLELDGGEGSRVIALSGLVEHRNGVQDVVAGSDEGWEVVVLDVVDDCLTFLADKNIVLALHQTTEDRSGCVEGSIYNILCQAASTLEME